MSLDEKTLSALARQDAVDETEIPDYSDEEGVQVPPDAIKRLTSLVVQMGMLEVETEDLEAKLAEKKAQLAKYKENLVPEAMKEISLTELKTSAGIKVAISEKLVGTLPKDQSRRALAFSYLRETGNDGLLKREIVISYGRDSDKYAEDLMAKLDAMGVGDHAEVKNEINIHHQSMMAFLRREVEAGRPVPLEAFGVVQKWMAEIKRGK